MTSRACSPDPADRAGSANLANPAKPADKPVLVLSGPEDPQVLVLAFEGRVLASLAVDASGRAMPVLAPAVAHLLSENGASPEALGGVACVRGPGSFTGLRSVLALGTGIALGAGLPMAGLDYLPILARGAAGAVTGRLFIAAYARSAQVYLQAFDVRPGAALKACGPPEALFLETARARLCEAAASGPMAVAGSGAAAFGRELTGDVPEACLLPERFSRPDPEALALAAHEAVWSWASSEPLYLRPSDAEENLAAIAASRGISPRKADRLFRELTSRPAK